MKYYKVIILLVHLLFIYGSYSIKLNSIAISYSNEDQFFTSIVNDFNEYAKANKLDIELDIDVHSSNDTLNLSFEYRKLLKELFNNESSKYDIFFYDVTYTNLYISNFLELNNELPNEYFIWYSTGIGSETCVNNGKWIGFPININYRFLYTNMDLLNKHGQKMPETWDEMINTTKYILEKERDEGNTDLIGYNGFIPDYETNLSSVEEFVYSFRENEDSAFPDYHDNTASKALTKLKQIKDEISSSEIFRANDEETIKRLDSGKAIFLKFWDYPKVNSVYNKTILLGNKKGVSGTSIGGYNMSINKRIPQSHKESTIETFKYIASRKLQKKYLMENHSISGINNLYTDKEVCQIINCDLINSIQSFYHRYDEYYYGLYREMIYKYLYNNGSLEETLHVINGINTFSFVDMNSSDTSTSGYVIFIIVVSSITLIVLSLSLLCNYRLNMFFSFFSTTSWLSILFGNIVIMLSIYPEYNEITSLKCKFKYIILSCGVALNALPVFHVLLTKYATSNKCLEWIKKNKYSFFFIYYIIDLILYGVLLLIDFNVKEYISLTESNFKYCSMNNVIGHIVLCTLVFTKLLLYFGSTILLYLKWNDENSKMEIRLITSDIILNYILIIMLIIVYSLKYTDYKTPFLLNSILIILLALSNYLLLYCSKIVKIYKNKDKIEQMNIRYSLNVMRQSHCHSHSHSQSSSREHSGNVIINTNSFNGCAEPKGMMSKIIQYHYNAGNDTIIENANFSQVETMTSKSFTQPPNE
ncbi:periplasmic binding protein-like II [Anaeromyces robustus]|uniref:Periplasmic binding protein-like II n=1 Tax=Anaeromyces robustus TaxID=1754192 RepID=A0A1Y1X680_9FUNG|nr:periplasmic binding protein-like II [Anaeromyces robustus]|eukprot:ORX81293.1 periplasmic binding protein-like II [Anaeromyces robustus]